MKNLHTNHSPPNEISTVRCWDQESEIIFSRLTSKRTRSRYSISLFHQEWEGKNTLFSFLRKSFFAKFCCNSRAMPWSRIRKVWVLWVRHWEVSRWGDWGLIQQFLLGLLILLQEAVDVSGDLWLSFHWSITSFLRALIIFKGNFKKLLLFVRVNGLDFPVH